jgi:hypothetical protein
MVNGESSEKESDDMFLKDDQKVLVDELAIFWTWRVY